MIVRTMPGTRPRSSLPAGWKPYEWKKTPGWNPGAVAWRGRRPGRRRKPPAPCGTLAGRWAHRRRGGKPCEACREAYNAARRKGTPVGRPRTSECGSEGGYRRHLVDGAPVCERCREAVNAVNRERYAAARCPACKYLRTAPGHKAECGGEAS